MVKILVIVEYFKYVLTSYWYWRISYSNVTFGAWVENMLPGLKILSVRAVKLYQFFAMDFFILCPLILDLSVGVIVYTGKLVLASCVQVL